MSKRGRNSSDQILLVHGSSGRDGVAGARLGLIRIVTRAPPRCLGGVHAPVSHLALAGKPYRSGGWRRPHVWQTGWVNNQPPE